MKKWLDDYAGKVSTTGYRRDSKDKTLPWLTVPSGDISMKNVDFPIKAYPENGTPVTIYPGQEYNFPGSSYVKEIPIGPTMQTGGKVKPPIYTNDPNDKRLRMYNDSLNSYNWGINELAHAEEFGTLKDFNTNTEVPVVRDRIINPNIQTRSNQPDYMTRFKRGDGNIHDVAHYKEPIQPYIYQQGNFNVYQDNGEEQSHFNFPTRQAADSFIKARTTYQDGGNIGDWRTGMMKSKIATADAMGNTAAHRMVQNYPQTYTFTGLEGTEPAGSVGTHYMGSYDNYAVPSIQQRYGQMMYIDKPSTKDKEAIKFNTPENADYFAEHYKEVAPMMRNSNQYQDGGPIGYTKNANKPATLTTTQMPQYIPQYSQAEQWYRDHPEQHIGPSQTPEYGHEYMRNKMYQQADEERANREFAQKLAPASDLAKKFLNAEAVISGAGTVRNLGKTAMKSYVDKKVAEQAANQYAENQIKKLYSKPNTAGEVSTPSESSLNKLTFDDYRTVTDESGSKFEVPYPNPNKLKYTERDEKAAKQLEQVNERIKNRFNTITGDRERLRSEQVNSWVNNKPFIPNYYIDDATGNKVELTPRDEQNVFSKLLDATGNKDYAVSKYNDIINRSDNDILNTILPPVKVKDYSRGERMLGFDNEGMLKDLGITDRRMPSYEHGEFKNFDQPDRALTYKDKGPIQPNFKIDGNNYEYYINKNKTKSGKFRQIPTYKRDGIPIKKEDYEQAVNNYMKSKEENLFLRPAKATDLLDDKFFIRKNKYGGKIQKEGTMNYQTGGKTQWLDYIPNTSDPTYRESGDMYYQGNNGQTFLKQPQNQGWEGFGNSQNLMTPQMNMPVYSNMKGYQPIQGMGKQQKSTNFTDASDYSIDSVRKQEGFAKNGGCISCNKKWLEQFK